MFVCSHSLLPAQVLFRSSPVHQTFAPSASSKMKQASSLAFLSFLASAYGHDFVTSRPARLAGQAMAAACGQQMFSQETSDNYGNIRGEMQVMGSDFDASQCNLWLCKGYQFADNAGGVQSFILGQTVPITVDIRAPHTGTANVSIVHIATNTVIGDPLISFAEYASNALPVPTNERNFDVTIPNDLGGKCATAGDCVIQWYWDARSIDQTYEACIDFTVGGASGNGGPSSAPFASSSASFVATLSSSVSLKATSSIETGIDIPTPTGESSSTLSEATALTTPAAASSTAPATSAAPSFTTELSGGNGQKYICYVDE